MNKFTHSTKVQALANQPFMQADNAANAASNDEHTLNSSERVYSDHRLKNSFSRSSQPYKLATLNCRTLNSTSSKVEFDKLMQEYDISITYIQEHRFVHDVSDPNEVARDLGTTTLFTASAEKMNVVHLLEVLALLLNLNCCHHSSLSKR